MSFCHLHVHSDASLLDGMSKVKDIAKKAKKLGHPAVALTDHGNIYNAVAFYKACKKEGVKPILGCEFYFVPDIKYVKEEKIRTSYHLTVLAKNNEGWRNIVKMVSEANHPDNFYHTPRIDYDILERHKNGLIVLTGCMGGMISKSLMNDNPDQAIDFVKRIHAMFGDDVYFETQNAGLEGQDSLNEAIRMFAKEVGRPTVATVDSHYINREDAMSHIELETISTGSREFVMSGGFGLSSEFFFKSRDEVQLPEEEKDVTLEIAEQCNVEIDLTKQRFPAYNIKEDESNVVNTDELLRKKLTDGWNKRLSKEQRSNPEYKSRALQELGEIAEAGFVDYFLIVADIVQWAKESGIWVGPSRGSVAGSLLAYLLYITDVDPIKHGLIFERFYNSGRSQSAPDIDTDIELRFRKDVINYIGERFGHDKVSQLMTLNTMAARAAIKDIMRVNDVNFEIANEITSLVPLKNDEHGTITLKEAFEKSERLTAYSKDPNYEACFRHAQAIEGVAKSIGTHAAAVIISDKPFSDGELPLVRSPDGHGLICGWDMKTIDSLNILKCDILGLATLEVLHRCCDFIKERHGTIIDFDNLDYEDDRTYGLICRGLLDGVFQIETHLGKKWAKLLMPTSLSDIADLLALIRPGPMDCLSGSTRILTNYAYNNNKGRNWYQYKTVKELYEKIKRLKGGNHRYSDSIVSVDESEYKYVRNQILDIVESGEQELFKVNVSCRLSGQYSIAKPGQRNMLYIEATKNHRFLTPNGWRRLHELKKGDYVAITNRGYGVRRCNKSDHVHGKKNFRNIAFNNYEYRCVLCDWGSGSLDVNHIDGNRYSNNDVDNLVFLCPNHHRMYSEGNIKKDTIIEYREQYKLPFTSDILFVRFEGTESLGFEMTYDICVKEPHHNFIAGDFVVHNSKMTNEYRLIKHGEKQTEYIHPLLKPILEPTYGVLIFQEQILEICKKIANMTLKEGDEIRRCLGKKLPDEMRKWKDKFIEKSVAHTDIKLDDAASIWSWIEAFAGYGFGRSHALGYAIIAYRTAYLKAHYPLEFLCACLICSKYNQKPLEEVKRFVNDAKLFGISTLPPDIRAKNVDFAIDDDTTIRFGLSHIKNLGESAINKILESGNGLDNFYEYIMNCPLNKNAVLALIASGALDCFGIPRDRMANEYTLYKQLSPVQQKNLKSVFKVDTDSVISITRKMADEDEVENWKTMGIRPPNVNGRKKLRKLVAEYEGMDLFSDSQIVDKERETLGISTTPRIVPTKGKDSCLSIKMHIPPGTDNIRVSGYVVDAKIFRTKQKGDKMAFISIEDSTYILDGVVVFPKLYSRVSSLLKPDRLIHISGNLDNNGTLLCRKIEA